jgi:hypothetical protein
MDEESVALQHRRAAEAHEEAAGRHDEAAADALAHGDVEGAGRELLNALIERQLAEDERQLAAVKPERESVISGRPAEDSHAR